MKDFLHLIIAFIIGIIIGLGLFMLVKINIFILTLLGIVASVIIIGGGVLYFRKTIAYHNLPKDKQKEHLKDYKETRKNLE